MRFSKSYFINTLFPILVYGAITGIIVGGVIWGYTFLAEWLGEHTVQIYTFTAENPLFIPLLFIGLAGLAILAWATVKLVPSAKGSGVPYIEGVMRGLLPLKWLTTAIAMLLGSLVSFFAGLPLGSEGPSVLIGGCLGNGVNDVGSKKSKSRFAWKRQTVTAGAAAGFAVAFNAPLAGILFALEEGHKRFSPMILLPAAASVIMATLTSNLLTELTGHGIANVIFTEFSSAQNPTLKETGYFLLLGISTGFFAVVFSTAMNALNDFFLKIKLPSIAKFLAAFLLTGIVGIFFADAIGGGSQLIRKIALVGIEWKLMLALLIIKLVQIIFCSTSGATGGCTIPVMALGALFGGLMAKLFVKMGMDAEYYNLIVLISMCAMLGAVMRAPIMSVVLVVEMTRVTVHLWAVCLVITLSYFVIELFNVEAIFDKSLSNILKERNAGKKRKLVELEVEIEHNSFAVGRCVRDILWPANTIVLKVKKTDADGNPIYRMDKDGERIIHAGDRFIIQAETSNFEKTYRELCFIVKRPDFVESMSDTLPEDE